MLAAISLAGCQAAPTMPKPELKLATWSSLSDDQKTISQLEDLLVLMQQLLEADAVTHKNLDAQLQQQYEADPSDTNKMRLALALTTPGHSRADVAKSQRLIEELKTEKDPLPPVISLYLKTRIGSTKHTNALEDKVKTLSSDNKDLNHELEDVRAQIKALTAIEQNLEKTSQRTGTR
jgi:2-keto-4-pentenoate hydratase/2-oxohepta-3-ene-1,7-dioic acid hydratase in catechol pathway